MSTNQNKEHTKKKRVLILAETFVVGAGTARSTKNLIEALSDKYDVECLTYHTIQTDTEYNCKVKRYSFGIGITSNILRAGILHLIYFPLKLAYFLHKHKYDIVISNDDTVNVSALLVRVFRKYRLCISIHTNYKYTIHKYFSWLYRFADHIVAVSKGVAQGFDATVIYNALDRDQVVKKAEEPIPDLYENIFSQNRVLVAPSRLHRQKNLLFLIDVFGSIAKKYDDIMFVIIGEGPYRQEISDLIQKKKLQEKVILTGLQKNVFPFLSRASLFVMASKYEGFANVVLEALSQGCPVVSSNCPFGPSELLDDSLHQDMHLSQYKKAKYGYLVPENNKEQFIAATEDALINGEVYRKLGIDRAKQFTNQILIQKRIDIIDERK